MENQQQFNTWKSLVEDIEIKTQLDCLRIIELNISNVCNLKCSFCPQSHGWKTNKEMFMGLHTVKEICKQLNEIDYKGFVCIAGWGEPSTNPNFYEIVDILKSFNPQIVTNGKLLDKDVWEKITKIAQIKVSVHDWSNIQWFKSKFQNTNAWYRNHDVNNPQMNLYNRGGYLNKPIERIYKECYLPFYKIAIDVDGKYIQCEADWECKSETENSIWNTHIENYFVNKCDIVREKMLSENKRQSFNCCKDCDIDGRLYGKKFVDFWINNVKEK